MFRCNLACLCSLGIWLLLAVGTNAAAETYRTSALHATFELPEGWQSMTAAEIAKINQVTAERMPGQQIRYESGFRPKGSAPGSYPYILLQLEPRIGAAPSYEAIEQALGQTNAGSIKEVSGSLGDLIQGLEVGNAALDRSRNRILLRLSARCDRGRTRDRVTVTHLGYEGDVRLHCYAQDKDFAKFMPTFTGINNSFRFDSGYTFVPGRGSRLNMEHRRRKRG